MTPMFNTLAPKESNPPSLNKTACTISTSVMARQPAHGPKHNCRQHAAKQMTRYR